MKRREFIGGLGAAAAWPVAARAQQPAMPVIGFLYQGSPEAAAGVLTPMRNGLSEAGYVEGRNVAIEYRFAHNETDRLPELAADLVRRRVAVIVTPGSTEATFAAKAATSTIPIVFQVATNPVQTGLVASLNRPGGNATGFTTLNTELAAKRLGLLHELKPGAAPFALLGHPNNQNTWTSISELRAAGTGIGRQIELVTAITNRDIDTAFASLAQKQVGALLLTNDTLFIARRIQIVALAIRYSMPTMFYVREGPEAGGLMS
jgi:ABC-type uncharacterized transport system substrate-binding protein